MEPLTIMFRGAPGVGKSQLMDPFIQEMLMQTLPPYEVENYRSSNSLQAYVYNRMAETQYWDGYVQQHICLFDDFGQYVDQPGSQDNEYFNMIRASNQFPMTCHMAHLEQKGSTFFRSKIIVANSNVLDFSQNVIQSIRSVEAFERRFHLTFEVVPPLEYCQSTDVDRIQDRKLDKSKLKAPIDFNAFEFHLIDTVTNEPVQVMKYKDVVKMCVDRYYQQEEQYARRVEQLENRMDQIYGGYDPDDTTQPDSETLRIEQEILDYLKINLPQSDPSVVSQTSQPEREKVTQELEGKWAALQKATQELQAMEALMKEDQNISQAQLDGLKRNQFIKARDFRFTLYECSETASKDIEEMFSLNLETEPPVGNRLDKKTFEAYKEKIHQKYAGGKPSTQEHLERFCFLQFKNIVGLETFNYHYAKKVLPKGVFEGTKEKIVENIKFVAEQFKTRAGPIYQQFI